MHIHMWPGARRSHMCPGAHRSHMWRLAYAGAGLGPSHNDVDTHTHMRGRVDTMEHGDDWPW